MKNYNKFYIFIFLVFSYTNILPSYKKIVGAMAVRNESDIIEQSIRALSMYTDAIVILDDASDDNSVEIIKNLAGKCKIEKIIEKKIWIRDERGDRNLLLKACREIGGTHFIFLDADEMFSSLCINNKFLRKEILKLEKGQAIGFPLVNLWDSTYFYRNDDFCNPTTGRWKKIPVILCDDGVCNYDDNNNWSPSGAIHICRIPENRICNATPKLIVIEDINYGLIHFKSVNLENLLTKRAWYMCLELIKLNEKYPGNIDKNIETVNNSYSLERLSREELSIDNVKVEKVPENWFSNYNFFDRNSFDKDNVHRKNQIIDWFKTYGINQFLELKMWLTPWLKNLKHENLNFN